MTEESLGAIILGAIATVVALRFLNRRKGPAVTRTPLPSRVTQATVADPFKFCSFGRKCCWLAIKSAEPANVVAALDLESGETVQWGLGVFKTYSSLDGLFISPSFRGWVFVVGYRASLPNEKAFPNYSAALNRLSNQFGEVQAFGSHRVSSWYTWIKSVSGKIQRAVIYNDGALVQEGVASEQEIEILKPGEEGAIWVQEEHVLAIAAEWGIDPSCIEFAEVGEEAGTYVQTAKNILVA
jgi:hypothetical protein